MAGVHRTVSISVVAIIFAALSFASESGELPFSKTFRFSDSWRRQWQLESGQAFELSVHLQDPGALPANARIEVQWQGPEITETFDGERGDLHATATPNWRKTLHALDPDVYLVYQAPKEGIYQLQLKTVLERSDPQSAIPRDTGLAPLSTPLLERTPAVKNAVVTVEVLPIEELQRGDILLEAEPNDTPEQAVDLPFQAADEDQVLRVFGGALRRARAQRAHPSSLATACPVGSRRFISNRPTPRVTSLPINCSRTIGRCSSASTCASLSGASSCENRSTYKPARRMATKAASALKPKTSVTRSSAAGFSNRRSYSAAKAANSLRNFRQ